MALTKIPLSKPVEACVLLLAGHKLYLYDDKSMAYAVATRQGAFAYISKEGANPQALNVGLNYPRDFWVDEDESKVKPYLSIRHYEAPEPTPAPAPAPLSPLPYNWFMDIPHHELAVEAGVECYVSDTDKTPNSGGTVFIAECDVEHMNEESSGYAFRDMDDTPWGYAIPKQGVLPCTHTRENWRNSISASYPLLCYVGDDIDEVMNTVQMVRSYDKDADMPYRDSENTPWRYATPFAEELQDPRDLIDGYTGEIETADGLSAGDYAKEEHVSTPNVDWVTYAEDNPKVLVWDGTGDRFKMQTLNGYRGTNAGYPFRTNVDEYKHCMVLKDSTPPILAVTPTEPEATSWLDTVSMDNPVDCYISDTSEDDAINDSTQVNIHIVSTHTTDSGTRYYKSVTGTRWRHAVPVDASLRDGSYVAPVASKDWRDTVSRSNPVSCFISDNSIEETLRQGNARDIYDYKHGSAFPYKGEFDWIYAVPVDPALRSSMSVSAKAKPFWLKTLVDGNEVECYVSDTSIEHALEDGHTNDISTYTAGSDYPYEGNVSWKYAIPVDPDLR